MKRLLNVLTILTTLALCGCATTQLSSAASQEVDFSGLSHQNVMYEGAKSANNKNPVARKQYVAVAVPGQLMPIDTSANKPTAFLSKEKAVQYANKKAMLEPKSSNFFNSVMTYDFMPGSLYVIYTTPENITDLAFAPGEKLISEASGDTLRWSIGKTFSGQGADQVWHILVKPYQAGIQTSLMVTTDRHVYHMVLKSTNNNTYMVSVHWQYPEAMVKSLSSGNAASSNANAMAPAASDVALTNLHFDYQFGMVAGNKPAWYPERVFDNGRQTFIKLPQGVQNIGLPVVYASSDGVEYSSDVNWRIAGNYLIINDLVQDVQLISGVDSKDNKTIVQIKRT